MQALVKCATSWAGDSWHGPSIIGIQKRCNPSQKVGNRGSPSSMHEQFQTKPCAAVPSIHFIWFLSLAARSFVFLVRRLFLVQPSFSRLFFLFIYHHLLRRAPLLWQVFKEERKLVPSEKRRPKIVAVRLRCNIASSCHILLPFRLNSRRCRPEDKDDVEDVHGVAWEIERESKQAGPLWGREVYAVVLSSPLLALTQATIYSVSG